MYGLPADEDAEKEVSDLIVLAATMVTTGLLHHAFKNLGTDKVQLRDQVVSSINLMKSRRIQLTELHAPLKLKVDQALVFKA